MADPGEREHRGREVAVGDACDPVVRVVVREQRLGARRDDHGADETAASESTVAGARRSTGASAKQRKGSSGTRKRGPGTQPPSASS